MSFEDVFGCDLLWFDYETDFRNLEFHSAIGSLNSRVIGGNIML